MDLKVAPPCEPDDSLRASDMFFGMDTRDPDQAGYSVMVPGRDFTAYLTINSNTCTFYGRFEERRSPSNVSVAVSMLSYLGMTEGIQDVGIFIPPEGCQTGTEVDTSVRVDRPLTSA